MTEIEKISSEQLILEAAEQEFLTKGYDGARTISIAQKAGVTHAMLHYYYRTKRQLFECILAKTINTVKETMLAAMGDPDMPLVERLKDGIASHFDHMVAGSESLEVIHELKLPEISIVHLGANLNSIPAFTVAVAS